MPVSTIIVLAILGFTLIATIAISIVRVVLGRIRKRVFAEHLAKLESDGIVRQTDGYRGGSIRYRNYRAPGRYYGVAIKGWHAALVLTRRELVILTMTTQRIAYAELAKYKVSTKDGKLVIETDEPPKATGHVAMHLRVPDADEWVAALTRARGAAA